MSPTVLDLLKEQRAATARPRLPAHGDALTNVRVIRRGGQGLQPKYYALPLVFHDQPEPDIPMFESYEQTLRDTGLPSIRLEANCKFCDLSISRSCQQYGYNSDSSGKSSE